MEERLTSGELYADLIVDRTIEPPIHHWIIQRKGSPEIMFWDMSFDGAGAEDRVRWHLEYFNRAAQAQASTEERAEATLTA